MNTGEKMSNKEKDWSNLGFSYQPIAKRFVATFKDGQWDEGKLVDDPNITISESAGVLQYAQTCFEGLKAKYSKEGNLVVFRPELNAKRMYDTCEKLCIPPVPVELFLKAVGEVVKANPESVPPYGSGASLYIRPFVFGSGPVIGVAPSSEYTFRVFGTPVGPYFKGGLKPIKLMVSEFDRAAPRGTGHVKAGLNYAMSIYAGQLAHSRGFNENMFLDAQTRTFVEETGGANFLFVTKDGKIVTPKSPSILPSITRISLVTVAKDILHLEIEERPVLFTELEDFVECALCGTAAVISPVGMVHSDEKDIFFPTGMEQPGPITQKLYDTLTGIQMEEIPAPEGWIRIIK
ncbi:MAG: branched-chain amino acid aminotransferase [Spirochaetaceae bacterium]|nr:branched-chain amino acid aminotransferase [Spirochaetaceae bacterium]